jgi:hypothetical protein
MTSESIHAWLLVALVVTVSAVPAAAGATVADPRVERVEYTGTGNVTVAPDGLSLWASESHEFTATVTTTEATEARLCLVAVAGATERELGCRAASLPANVTTTRSVSVPRWPADLNGTTRARLVLRASESEEALAVRSLPVTVIRTDGDLDGDGLANGREASLGTALDAADTDGDGLTDDLEADTYETSPTAADTDGDGLADGEELNAYMTSPTAADTDDDGLGDAREIDLRTDPTRADTDGDGLADGPEVTVHDTDPQAADTDGDGLGDGVEATELGTNPLATDTDDDGLTDAEEVNTYGTDPTKIDSDGDGLADGAEVDEHGTDPLAADSDGDGLADGQEVNTYGTDPNNPDTDGDRLSDGAEVNRHGTDPDDVDTDGDGRSDYAEVTWAGVVPFDPRVLLVAGTLVAVLGGGLFYRSGRLPGGATRLPDAASAGAAADAATVDGDDEVPSELLSSEDRVLRLLDANDGRMRQADIVEETGWSKSKVSRVLAGMDEEGQIVKVDVGRGNLIARPGDLPAGLQPPSND